MVSGYAGDNPRDHCGVFGIANHDCAVELTRQGLFSLQHRGQESAGIYRYSDGKCLLHKAMGLVGDVFREMPPGFAADPGSMAIGHVRYSTAGGSNLINAQPFVVEFDTFNLGRTAVICATTSSRAAPFCRAPWTPRPFCTWRRASTPWGRRRGRHCG